MNINLDANFWNQRYEDQDTGWDLKSVSPPIKKFFETYSNKKARILIPGAGNAWEAEFIFNAGFKEVHVLDYAALAVENFKKRFPAFPSEQIFCEDFFKHRETYDCIVEQTFFCALDPNLRTAYVEKMFDLLRPGGFIVGLLFNDALNSDKPPFGGNETEYRSLFEKKFELVKLETAYNSAGPRAEREFFILFRAKK